MCNSENAFWAFVAGYSDAEGSIGIYSGRARFRLGSYDALILKQIHEKFNEFGIKNSYRLEEKAREKPKLNNDFYRVDVMDRYALRDCLIKLLQFIKHIGRRRQALEAIDNLKSRL